MTEPTHHYLAERLAHLLAESSLSEKTKTTILGALPALPDRIVLDLMASLEQERVALKDLMFELEKFQEKQEAAWASLEARQEEAGHKAAEAAVSRIVQESQLSAVRDSLK